MMNTILGKKIEQTQDFLTDGTRIPVTRISVVGGNTVVFIKNQEKNGYNAFQIGFGTKKNANAAMLGQIKGANLKTAPQFLREVKAENNDLLKIGDVIKANDVLKPGDIIDVNSVSKGKGFQGGVKKHHFKGGPRTHGQSDRERAPGSIGQTTTPGRVYKGKRMAAKMGRENVTIKNLQVVEVTDDSILIKGLVPGAVNTMITIKKVGEDKKFVPLYREIKEEAKAEAENKKAEEAQSPKPEAKEIKEEQDGGK